MKTSLAPNSRINRLRGYLRLWNNQCPRCNSDAPLVDRCGVCNNVHNAMGGISPNRRCFEQYPPSRATKALWLYSWMHPHADDKQTWMDSRESDQSEGSPPSRLKNKQERNGDSLH
jgi:hypothetical protein